MIEPTRLSQEERNRLSLVGELVDVVTWGRFPLLVTHGVRASKLGVVPAGCFYTDEPATPAPHGNVSWAYGSAEGEVKLTGVDGLVSGTKYTLTLLIVGKE